MGDKTAKRYMFEVKLEWLSSDVGMLSSGGAEEHLTVVAPAEFGGTGKSWTPESLLLGAVASCFMTTFHAFARKMDLSFTGLSCHAIGQIELVEGKLKFTHIDVYPIVTIEKEELNKTAAAIMEKTHKHCLVSNSLNATIIYHSEILTRQTVGEIKQSRA
jgi:peroxiredoxin-like protein